MEEAVGRSPRSTLFSGLGDDPITAEIARHGRLYDETHHVLRQLRVRERHIRYTIAGLVLIFGIVGTLALFTPGGAQGSMWRSLVLAIAAATTIPTAIAVSRVPLGVMWWTKKSHVRGFNNVFVAYADVGLAVCLFATADPRLALYFSALFAVVGSYSAHFVRARVVYLHMAFSSAVICALGVLAWMDGVPPVTAFSATLALLVAVNGTVTLHQGYTSDLQRTLKHQLRMANTDPPTSTASNGSTTTTGMPWATWCCSRSPRSSRTRWMSRRSSPGSEGTSSRSRCRSTKRRRVPSPTTSGRNRSTPVTPSGRPSASVSRWGRSTAGT